MDTGCSLGVSAGERIIRLVAHHVGVEVHQALPRLSTELPDSGARFEGLLPPLVSGPTFAIRKPAGVVFTLGDYVRKGILTEVQAGLLRSAVQERRNILVVGPTSSGKPACSKRRSRPETSFASTKAHLLHQF